MSLTAEQLQTRRRGIGASDAAAALGLNPYSSPVELWLEKLGRTPPFEGNAATRWGNLLEPAVRQEYAEQTGRVVRLPLDTLHHKSVPYLLCHPDGITDDGRLYEGKTARFPDGWGEPGSDQIPHHYLLQVQHAMMVCELEVADVAVLIGGQDFRLYEVRADRELQDVMLEGEAVFWQHVEREQAPPINFEVPGAIALLRKLYPGTNGQTVSADSDCERLLAEYEDACAGEKSGKARAEAAKAQLLAFMGEATLLKFPDGRALRRSLVSRKGYEVKPTSHIDARLIASKE